MGPGEERQGLAGWGAFTPWQLEQAIPEPPPEKSLPWQIRQEANPELPGAFFAAAPWVAARAQPGTVPWWHVAVKQEVLAIPPARSLPWQEVH